MSSPRSPATNSFGESRAHTTQFQPLGGFYKTTASDYGSGATRPSPTVGHHTRSVGDAYGNRARHDGGYGASKRIL